MIHGHDCGNGTLFNLRSTKRLSKKTLIFFNRNLLDVDSDQFSHDIRKAVITRFANFRLHAAFISISERLFTLSPILYPGARGYKRGCLK